MNELAAALAKAQGVMKHAAKTAENPAFKRDGKATPYADMAAVVDAAKEALAENGLSISQLTDVAENGDMFLVTQMTHSSGQWLRGWYPIKPVKNDPQGLGAAITYARRYSFCAITGVVAEGEDDDGNKASGVTPAVVEKGEFENADLRENFAENCIWSIGKAINGADLKTIRDCNLAKWNAMKDSAVTADVEAYNQVIEAYNKKYTELKSLAESKTKQSTVDGAIANG